MTSHRVNKHLFFVKNPQKTANAYKPLENQGLSAVFHLQKTTFDLVVKFFHFSARLKGAPGRDPKRERKDE